MKDRVPLYPGRVKLVPVSGQANTYDMERADQPTQVGDPLNKNTLLKDETAALLGLTPDAVPDDALALLSPVLMHHWKRRTYTPAGYKIKVSSKISSPICDYSDTYTTTTVEIGDVTIVDGEIVFTTTSSFTVSYNNYTLANTLKGKYFKLLNGYNAGGPYYMDENESDAHREYFNGEYLVYLDFYRKVSAVHFDDSYGDWEIVTSPDENAYPKSGILDGYEHSYLGIPYYNAISPAKIATGSYTGTGTYGSSNPNSLTFEFEPKIVYISEHTSITGMFLYIWGGTQIAWQNGNYSVRNTASVSGNVLSWYYASNDSSGALYQLNYSGATYDYIAIG